MSWVNAISRFPRVFFESCNLLGVAPKEMPKMWRRWGACGRHCLRMGRCCCGRRFRQPANTYGRFDVIALKIDRVSSLLESISMTVKRVQSGP